MRWIFLLPAMRITSNHILRESSTCGVVPTKLVWKCVFVVRIDKVRQVVSVRLSFTMCFSLTCTFDYNHHILADTKISVEPMRQPFWLYLLTAGHTGEFMLLTKHCAAVRNCMAVRDEPGRTDILSTSLLCETKNEQEIQPSFMIAIHLTVKLLVCLQLACFNFSLPLFICYS